MTERQLIASCRVLLPADHFHGTAAHAITGCCLWCYRPVPERLSGPGAAQRPLYRHLLRSSAASDSGPSDYGSTSGIDSIEANQVLLLGAAILILLLGAVNLISTYMQQQCVRILQPVNTHDRDERRRNESGLCGRLRCGGFMFALSSGGHD